MTRPPTALSIAGSDPSGGAGIQADLKTFSALGAYGMAALTSLTAQNTRGVSGVHVVPEDFVAAQIGAVVDDIRLDAVKIGMLATAGITRTVGRLLDDLAAAADPTAPGRAPRGPVVVLDPVMVATSGDRLLDTDAVVAMRQLLPRVDLVTPNVPEAATLLGRDPATDVSGLRDQARALLDLGASRVLLKGGHLDDARATDVFADSGGVHDLTTRHVETDNTHGTGCSLSSAIAALRPQHDDWLPAVTAAKDWLTGALAAADTLDIGRGHGPVHHFHGLWSTR